MCHENITHRCVFQAPPKTICWRLWTASGRSKVTVLNFSDPFCSPSDFQGFPKIIKNQLNGTKRPPLAIVSPPRSGSRHHLFTKNVSEALPGTILIDF